MKARLIMAATVGSAAQGGGTEKLLEPFRSLSDVEIEGIRKDLLEENPVLYWEIIARQMNLDYVPKEQRGAIEAVLASLGEA